ncbi:MAG: phosphopentomutase [Bacteroidota bacterium]|nr:phosphopentomutase [Bacteroidota bacterium]
MHKKVILVILDGVGVGELPDANLYKDEGSNTLANLSDNVASLNLPNLQKFGLGNIIPIKFVPPSEQPNASFGKMAAKSKGKDSTTGHWELLGVITEKEFLTYPNGFPDDLLEKFLSATNSKGYLGNKAASGTDIINDLGEEHQRTGFPIIYTSADSVFQIAAHEQTIPLERLYEICEISRTQVCIGKHLVGRIIARPFAGDPGNYKRTGNRRDFSVAPHGDTLLDILKNKNIPTIGIGKIDDLFAGRGLSEIIHTKSNAEGVRSIIEQSKKNKSGLIIANLVDFDQLYGHRNDPLGFANALEEFDLALPKIAETLSDGEWLILTADHGNDPITPSTDHSREYVPILCYSPDDKVGINLGIRESFADLAKTIGEIFELDDSSLQISGTSFYHSLINK